MSSISSLFSNNSLSQLTPLQGKGSGQGNTQAATSANDTFATMLSQLMSGATQAQNSDLTSLTGTQSASATGQTAATSAVSTSGQTSVSSDMNALSQALSAGNLSAAQQAFQSMQSDLQGTTAGAQQTHHHHHHHSGGDENLNASSTTGAAAATTPASAIAQTSSSDQASTSTGNGTTVGSQMLSLLMGLV